MQQLNLNDRINRGLAVSLATAIFAVGGCGKSEKPAPNDQPEPRRATIAPLSDIEKTVIHWERNSRLYCERSAALHAEQSKLTQVLSGPVPEPTNGQLVGSDNAEPATAIQNPTPAAKTTINDPASIISRIAHISGKYEWRHSTNPEQYSTIVDGLEIAVRKDIIFWRREGQPYFSTCNSIEALPTFNTIAEKSH